MATERTKRLKKRHLSPQRKPMVFKNTTTVGINSLNRLRGSMHTDPNSRPLFIFILFYVVVINVAQPWNKLMAAYLEKQRGLSIDDMDLSPEADLDAEQTHLYQHCLCIPAKNAPTPFEQKQLFNYSSFSVITCLM